MPLVRRSDGDLVRDLHPVRRIMPYLMPTRTECFVLCRQLVEMAPIRTFLESANRGRPADAAITPFHLLVRALARVMHEYPRVNRFLAGGRLYQRRGVWLSFSGKKAMSENAPIFTSKRMYPVGESLEEMVDALYGKLSVGRSDAETTTDKEVGLLLRLPGPMLRAVMRLARRLNDLNLLPAAMIESDPMFASAFIANLGSVGIDACYHHNYEYGSIPIFVTMGKVHRTPVVVDDDHLEVREVFEVKYTYDERIEDGFYCARGLEFVKHLLENPSEL